MDIQLVKYLKMAWHMQPASKAAMNLLCDVKHYQFGNISSSTTWVLENAVSMHINKEKFADRPD